MQKMQGMQGCNGKFDGPPKKVSKSKFSHKHKILRKNFQKKMQKMKKLKMSCKFMSTQFQLCNFSEKKCKVEIELQIDINSVSTLQLFWKKNAKLKLSCKLISTQFQLCNFSEKKMKS